jgi:hypothetical protein
MAWDELTKLVDRTACSSQLLCRRAQVLCTATACLLCLVKSPAPACSLRYCHRRLFIHAQSWLLLASCTTPVQQLHLQLRRISLGLSLFAGTSSALLAAIVLSSRRLPDVFSQAQDRRRHYPSRQCSMHASNHAAVRYMTGQLA